MIDRLCQSDYRLCFSQPIPTTTYNNVGLSLGLKGAYDVAQHVNNIDGLNDICLLTLVVIKMTVADVKM